MIGRRADEVGFTEFAYVAAPRLFRSALLLCGDWQLAEDLVQTTLAKLYVAWRRVQRSDDREAFARAAITNAYLSHQRVHRNQEVVVDLAQPSGSERVRRGLPDSNLRLDLFAALATLGPVDRAVVVLRYWEDLTVAETAGLLELTETQVRTRSFRAFARLREALDLSKEVTS